MAYPDKTLSQTSKLTRSNDSKALQQYLQAATSENTRKAYRSAIRQFEKWGGRLPTDQQTLIRYLLDHAKSLNPRTLDLHLTAIAQWHRYQGIRNPADDPTVRKTIEGIRRTHGAPRKKAKALRLEHIVLFVEYLSCQPQTLKNLRDQAMILTSFFGAFRRSELVGIEIEGLTWEPDGLLIQLKKSKTDQTGEGNIRALPFGSTGVCPGKAIRAWVEAANIVTGPLFRPVNRWDQIAERSMNPGAVNDMLKSLGAKCSLDFVPELSSHSFRRGLSTSAARERIEFELIKKQGGWKSDATVWEYIEEGQQMEENASKILITRLEDILTNSQNK